MEYAPNQRAPFEFRLTKDPLEQLLDYRPESYQFLNERGDSRPLGMIAELVANEIESDSHSLDSPDIQKIVAQIDVFFESLPIALTLNQVSYDDPLDGISCEFRDSGKETILTFKGDEKIIYSSLDGSGIQYGVAIDASKKISQALLSILAAHNETGKRLISQN